MTLLPKPSRTARKLAQKEARASRVKHEKDQKALVRRRDKKCRFPFCGCKGLGLALHVSHEEAHKGMGGDPGLERSWSSQMLLLCSHRHQDGIISRHRGNLRTEPVTERGADGPVKFVIDVSALPVDLQPSGYRMFANSPWRDIAVESSPGVIAPLTGWQTAVIAELRRMVL